MTTADYLQLLEPSDFTWPVSYRWHTTGPWGETQQDITVDVPELVDQTDPTELLGLELWKRAVAPATVTDVSLLWWETVIWKSLPFPSARPASMTFGLLPGTAASRDNSGCVVLHSGHADTYARRRFFLPGIPRSWLEGDVFSHSGMNALEVWGRMAYVGLARHITASPMLWLLCFPDVLPHTIENPTGVAFRRVEYLRCCWHTERAPDPVTGGWP